MAQTGNTATIAFGTQSFTANYYAIGGLEQPRAALRDSHLGTDNLHTYIPDDLGEPGTIDCEFEYDQQSQPDQLAAAETITITYPLKAGQVTAATLAGSGFLIRRRSADLRNGQIMTGAYTVQFDGKTEPVFTPGS